MPEWLRGLVRLALCVGVGVGGLREMNVMILRANYDFEIVKLRALKDIETKTQYMLTC